MAGLDGIGGLTGGLSASFCVIYSLDPTGTVPLEPLGDILPGLGPLRITMDAIGAENYAETYDVTQNTLQDLTDTTSNVKRNLIGFTVVGIFGAGLVTTVPGVPGSGLSRLARFDLSRFNNLRRMAAKRRPVMVCTPRVSLKAAFITSVAENWTPADGDSLPVSISFLEARVMTALNVAAFADVDSMATGNNSSTGGGTGGSSSVTTSGSAAGQGVPPVLPIQTVPF
jgi:hypothetical protein